MVGLYMIARYFICWWMALLYCPKPSCKRLFSGFLLSTVPYWNYCISLICHYNRNTHNVAFYIFSCRTLNDFYKPLVIIVVFNDKQMNWPYKQNYVKRSRYFYRKCFFKCRKNWKRAGVTVNKYSPKKSTPH